MVEAHRYIEESISDSVAASERSGSIGWKTGDVMIFTELDRFGRNVMDVRKTVEQLAGANVRVHYLALGGVSLTDMLSRPWPSSSGICSSSVLRVLSRQKRKANVLGARHRFRRNIINWQDAGFLRVPAFLRWPENLIQGGRNC